jgi:hypothetical protein
VEGEVRRRTFNSFVLILLLGLGPLLFGQSIDIQLAHDSPAEQQTKTQLERLLNQYDTSKYTFTRSIVIDDSAIPHSDPVLTLHTRHLQQDDELLSTYVHEQLHWYLDSKKQQTNTAEKELRALYPNPPMGGKEGARTVQSDYLHLIVCKLEWDADRQLLGDERAQAVMNFWARDHYMWVYQTVLADPDKIEAIIKHNSLDLE